MPSLKQTFVASLAAALVLGACSSPAKRQQRAYEKYVRSSVIARQKQQKKMRPQTADIPAAPTPAPAVESIELGD